MVSQHFDERFLLSMCWKGAKHLTILLSFIYIILSYGKEKEETTFFVGLLCTNIGSYS